MLYDVSFVLVGDRGMITSARIEEDLKEAPGLEWITALRGPAIRKLVDTGALDTIAQEAALDGIYVIRTSVALARLSPEDAVL